ncbi:hypothetical protein AB0I22_37125 [Streptomyces sp. NPDC050610]|uniref:hypothetical protein n=1 Tax=Streptomyces sp. NPDC050610 TaxID=3157097 RepID=UPI00342F1094
MILVRAHQGPELGVVKGVVDTVGGQQHQAVGDRGFTDGGDDSGGEGRADPCVVVLGDFGGNVTMGPQELAHGLAGGVLVKPGAVPAPRAGIAEPGDPGGDPGGVVPRAGDCGHGDGVRLGFLLFTASRVRR